MDDPVRSSVWSGPKVDPERSSVCSGRTVDPERSSVWSGRMDDPERRVTPLGIMGTQLRAPCRYYGLS